MKRSLKDVSIKRAAAWRLRVLAERLTGERATSSLAPGRPATGREPLAEQLAIARAEWRDQGASENLVAQARSVSRNSAAWSLLPPRLWLVYCGALLEAQDLDGAEQILRTWLVRRPDDLETLATCLPVARFARDLGIRSRLVERAAEAGDVLAANRDAGTFRALVEGRTIAVVGNGPGPLGAALGAEIDAHDLVVRFNNFPRGYEADYGERTDVWVRGAHREVRDRVEIEDFAMVLWEMDVFRNVLELPSHREVLYRDTQLAPEKVAHIDTETKRTLREASGLLLPTSGAQLLWMLHQARGSLDGVDVYGFSTVEGSDDHGHYFDALGDMGTRHDAAGEGRFLRALIAGADAPGADDDTEVLSGDDEVVVVSCAYRVYDPAAGKTGGPGGVLATQRLALGDDLSGRRLLYRFDDGGPGKAELTSRMAVQLSGLSGKITDVLVGAEHVLSDPEIRALRSAGRPMLLVCHELGTAYGAHLLGVPYVVVYHQQGSTLQEMRSNGRQPTTHEVVVADRLERVVLENAQQVYFPSLGALETYRSTAQIDVGRIPFADTALYNTVSAIDHGDAQQSRDAQREEIRRELQLPAADATTDVFVSVGDFNHDKGLDRVPALLGRYAELTGRHVVWVAVGAGSDKDLVERMRSEQKSWGITARLVSERMTHDKLLALLDLSDYYVMLHRNAIFDLATLEAMRAGKALVLSPVGGNAEVDLDGNVLFVTDDTLDDACRVLETRDATAWGERNRRVFEEHFSLGRFADRYRAMLDEQVARLATVVPDEPVPDGGTARPATPKAPVVAGSAS